MKRKKFGQNVPQIQAICPIKHKVGKIIIAWKFFTFSNIEGKNCPVKTYIIPYPEGKTQYCSTTYGCDKMLGIKYWNPN